MSALVHDKDGLFIFVCAVAALDVKFCCKDARARVLVMKKKSNLILYKVKKVMKPQM